MSFYWESHKKRLVGTRLAWYGDDANKDFWNTYWQQTLSASYYDQLKLVKLSDSDLGKSLQNELNSADKILEAGCGAGNWVAILLYNGFASVDGIEYSQELTDRIRQIAPQLNIRYEDALNVQVPDGYYDDYLSFGVVEHRFDGPEPFIQEAFRVLRPGGKAIFTVPYFGALRQFKAGISMYKDSVDGIPFFQFAFKKKDFTGLLEQHGFHTKTIKYLELDRLWLEEIGIYRKLAGYNALRSLQKKIVHILTGIDGHMLLVVCTKPA